MLTTTVSSGISYPHLTQGLFSLTLRFCVYEIGEALSFCQVHLAVLECSLGELLHWRISTRLSEDVEET